MAPMNDNLDKVSPSDLAISSLELDVLGSSLATRNNPPSLSPIDIYDLAHVHTKREASTYSPGSGSRSPESFDNGGFFALFAIIGVGMVLASLWFFFWAKNGGFHFQEGDWDDYKSTVLRRKGPDGRTLTNATKSTRLGGGSSIAGTQQYKWAKQHARSVVSKDEKGRKGVLGRRGWAGTHSILYSDDYMTESFGNETVSDMTELRDDKPTSHSRRYRDRDVQAYKKERPARVGGLNRVADGSHVDTSVEGSVTSDQPILHKSALHDKKRSTKPSTTQIHERERAERKAREEAAKMERRWKKEAEEAAAALAREKSVPLPSPPKKFATPSSSKPHASRTRSRSRSHSPKKRDFSYQAGAGGYPASEVPSTAYTGSSGQRTASYYDAYRPTATAATNTRRPTDGYESDYGRTRRSGSTSPVKKQGAGGRKAGYRRGGVDSDLE